MKYFWNDDNVNQIQEKSTAFETNNKKNNECSNDALLKLLENVKIKEDILLEFYSFNNIEEKIFKNDDYKSRFSFDVDIMFIKDEKFESNFLNKKRFSEDNEVNFYNKFMENEKNENNGYENHKKRGRKSKNKKGYKKA